MEKIGFIGGGNMARAIIGGLVQMMPASSVHVTDHHAEKREGLSRDFGVVAHDSTGSWVTGMDLVVLAVKPQTMKAACAELVPWLNRKGAALSIAAGIESDTICDWLWGYPVMRAMPNTPAKVRAGVTGYWIPPRYPEELASLVVRMFSACGDVIEVKEESQLDLVGAIPGSGPAYVFRFMEAFVRAAMRRGIPEEAAVRMVVGTFFGAAELARLSGEPLAQLRESVTSRGGTTAKALEVLESRGIDAAADEALEAALKRTEELKTLFL